MTNAELNFPQGTILGNGSHGSLVKRSQEWLNLWDFKTGIDSDFGDSTGRQVNAFRKKMGVAQNGTVDDKLFALLCKPMADALSDIGAGHKTINEVTVAYAKQHLAEHPLEVGGENRGPWVRLYCSGNDGSEYRWCAGFATFIVKHAATTVGATMPVLRTLSCDSLAMDAKAKGKFIRGSSSAPANLSPGDIFLIRKSSTDWSHTGLVLAVHGSTFDTIEGNTNDDGSPDGYEVCKRNRAFSSSVDFIDIA